MILLRKHYYIFLAQHRAKNLVHNWKLKVKLTLLISFCIKAITFHVEFLKFAETIFDDKSFNQCPSQSNYLRFH